MDEQVIEPYVVPNNATHPAVIAERLMQHEAHAHLKENEVLIEWLLKTDLKTKGGKQVIGAVHEPKVQGQLKDLFEMLLVRFFGEMPQFVIVLDREFWNAASPRDREALIWHELEHIKQAEDQYGAPKFTREGDPVYRLVEHDVAAFRSEVERYGAWSPDLVDFLAAAGRA